MDDVLTGLVPTVDVAITVTDEEVVTEVVYDDDKVAILETVRVSVRADVSLPEDDFDTEVDEVSDVSAEDDDRNDRVEESVDLNETLLCEDGDNDCFGLFVKIPVAYSTKGIWLAVDIPNVAVIENEFVADEVMVEDTVTVAQLLGVGVVLGERDEVIEDVTEILGDLVTIAVEVLETDDVSLTVLLTERVRIAVDVVDIVLHAVVDTERVTPGERLGDDVNEEVRLVLPDSDADGHALELTVVDEDIDGQADVEVDTVAELDSVRVDVHWGDTDVTIEFVNVAEILLEYVWAASVLDPVVLTVTDKVAVLDALPEVDALGETE
jgi:hypothetical protein